ncbi:MAG: gliding motility-associated ABC transporter permease subunit GldF [Flavobacteriaceae bacterium]
MWAVFRKEITSFFASPIAYLIIGIFLILNGLFLWVFEGTFNIFDYGFADLGNFFLLAPWILLLLIPAICMRSFSDEMKMGTLELIYISPASLWQIVLAKNLAAMLLSVLAVLPTLLYIYSISELGIEQGNLDVGLALGSYIGLLFLIMAYSSISVFTSSITDNQIVAFISGLLLCFVLFYLSEGLASLVQDGGNSLLLANMGLKARFETMARGILDSRDMIYFMSITALFIILTIFQLKYRAK